MNVNVPERIHFANIPTPIQKLPRLTKHLGGPEIYIKRDDLTGAGLSGNKIRKLEFTLAEAAAENADVVITPGGIQSNHCRATAAAAARLGMKSILFLRGSEPDAPQGNLLLDRLVGAEIRWITPEQYKKRDELMADAAREIKARGGTPYIIPEGASNEVGAWGYLLAAMEIAEQCENMGVDFNALFHAVGSGGTTAGLALGSRLKNPAIPIKSVAVCDDAEYFINRITGIMEKCVDRYKLDIPVSADAFEIIEGCIGPGYALPCDEVIETIKLVAELEGIFLDIAYTGKAMWGMIKEVRKGRFKKGDNLLFLHTGGIFSLFGQNTAFGYQ